MAKARLSEAAALERRRRERREGGGAVVDMRIDIEIADEIVLSCGGRWDRRLEDFDGEAQTRVLVTPHEGQVDTVLWFRSWLMVHAWRRDHPPDFNPDDEETVTPSDEVFSALLAGGRRSGKTYIAAVLCAMYAIQFPGAIVWILNPSNEKHDEVRRYMSQLLMPEWISRETQADGWELINGSMLALKSAYVGADPDAIKEGEAHLVWMNEGQKMAPRVFVVARGAISDRSGLVLVCANPPVETKDQPWVGDFASEAMDGRRAAVYHHMNPLRNPHINRRALLAMRKETDARTYRIEVLGEFLPPSTNVAFNWVRTADGNERRMPGPGSPWRDVTAQFLRMENIGDGFTTVLGMDFQVLPHMGGPALRIYAPSDQDPTRDNVVVWGVGEIVIEGDEEDWCQAAHAAGYDPDLTVIVGDGTGEYQHSRRRTTDSPPPQWSGRGSFDIIRGGGFPHIIRPDPRIRRNNPHVLDRCRALTSLIENSEGVRRLFLDPILCPKTCAALHAWPTVHGKPSRTHEAAHLGDGLSYPLVRLFPRLLRSGTQCGSDKPHEPSRQDERNDDGIGPLIVRRGRQRHGGL